jgi:agmatine deiminase
MSQQQGVNLVRSRLVLEGGALETDGEGTAIITESCVLNANAIPAGQNQPWKRNSKRRWIQ